MLVLCPCDNHKWILYTESDQNLNSHRRFKSNVFFKSDAIFSFRIKKEHELIWLTVFENEIRFLFTRILPSYSGTSSFLFKYK